MSAQLTTIRLPGDPEAWASIGFTIDASGRIPLLDCAIQIVDDAEPTLVFSGIDGGVCEVDGVRMEFRAEPVAPAITSHRNGALSIDHVVIFTSSIGRTSAALSEATGSPLKRIREAGAVRQGFHRIGPVIIELVEPTQADEREDGDRPRTELWGLVVNVADLDSTVERLGPTLISEAREAVQAGRKIATVRSAAGVNTNLALMTP